MADHASDPDQKKTETVPLPGEEGTEMIAQQNASGESSTGGGEWPTPSAPPTGPAPGTTPEGEALAARRGEEPPKPPPAGSASQDDQRQDAGTGGDRGPARSADTASGAEAAVEPPAMFKEVLEADRVAGGSRSGEPEEEQGTAR